MTTFLFQIRNDQWLSANQRLHWAAKAKRAAALRAQAAIAGELCHERYTTPVHITAHIGYSTRGKADPANALAVKHLIDGLVDSRVLVDDSHEHVIGPDYRRDTKLAPRGYHTVRLELVEQEMT